MKTILCPTDFSKAAKNAIDYAAEMATVTKSKLILFHAYQLPIAPAEVPIVFPVDDMEKNILQDLQKLEKHIHSKHGKDIVIECEYACGFPVEEIKLSAERHQASLIVMGMQGYGYLAEKLIGSVTTALIRSTHLPVLVIDTHVKFSSIKKVALACDYKEISNKSVLDMLKEIVQLFGSHVYVLNVVKELEAAHTVSRDVSGMRTDHLLGDVPHSFHTTQSGNVTDGINAFVDTHKIDLLVMIPHKHALLKQFFDEPQTKRMAFHAHTALLALHE